MRRPARGFLVLIIGKILLITHRLLAGLLGTRDGFIFRLSENKLNRRPRRDHDNT